MGLTGVITNNAGVLTESWRTKKAIVSLSLGPDPEERMAESMPQLPCQGQSLENHDYMQGTGLRQGDLFPLDPG